MSAEDNNLVQDSLEALIKVFELGSGFSDVSAILKVSGKLASAFPVVGAILALVGNVLPNVEHKEILSRFDQLSTQIDRVRDDIKNLGQDLGWQLTEVLYTNAVNHIELGIGNCLDIGRAGKQNSTSVAVDRLKKLCASEMCTLNLNNLLNGLTGKGLLTSGSILDKFEEAKAKGHRKKISPLATRLLQIATGGILVVSTYEAMLYGEVEAKRYIEQHGYVIQLQNASLKAQSVLDRCVEKFKENMLVDINSFLDKGGSNQDLATKISEFISDKYDWLENFVLVYDDMVGSKYHHFVGHFVDSLHRNGKCGVVFYRAKGESPRFSDRYREVNDIVDNFFCTDAEDCNKAIQAMMKEKGVGWTGCAVIRRQLHSGMFGLNRRDTNLFWKSTFSTQTVVAVGKLLERKNKFDKMGATKILLLQ